MSLFKTYLEARTGNTPEGFAVIGGFYPESLSSISEASDTSSLPKIPIIFDHNDVLFLKQFPYPMWFDAMGWRYNTGLMKFATLRENGGEYSINGKKSKNLAGSVPELADITLNTGRGHKIVFKSINPYMKGLIEKLTKPLTTADIQAISNMSSEEAEKQTHGDYGFDLSDFKVVSNKEEKPISGFKDIDDLSDKDHTVISSNYQGVKPPSMSLIMHTWLDSLPTGVLGKQVGTRYEQFFSKSSGAPPKPRVVIAHDGTVFYERSIVNSDGKKATYKVLPIDTNPPGNVRDDNQITIDFEVNGVPQKATMQVPNLQPGKAVSSKVYRKYEMAKKQVESTLLSAIKTEQHIIPKDEIGRAFALSGIDKKEVDTFINSLPTITETVASSARSSKVILRDSSRDKDSSDSFIQRRSFGAASPNYLSSKEIKVDDAYLQSIGISRSDYDQIMTDYLGAAPQGEDSENFSKTVKSPNGEKPDPVSIGIGRGIGFAKSTYSPERAAAMDDKFDEIKGACARVIRDRNGEAAFTKFVQALVKKEDDVDKKYNVAYDKVIELSLIHVGSLVERDLWGMGTRKQQLSGSLEDKVGDDMSKGDMLGGKSGHIRARTDEPEISKPKADMNKGIWSHRSKMKNAKAMIAGLEKQIVATHDVPKATPAEKEEAISGLVSTVFDKYVAEYIDEVPKPNAAAAAKYAQEQLRMFFTKHNIPHPVPSDATALGLAAKKLAELRTSVEESITDVFTTFVNEYKINPTSAESWVNSPIIMEQLYREFRSDPSKMIPARSFKVLKQAVIRTESDLKTI